MKFERAAKIMVRCCPHMKSLSVLVEEGTPYFEAEINVLLEGYGHQIQNLFIVGCENESNSYFTTIARTCKSLRSLQFCGFLSTARMEDLLPSIGDQLEEVNLCFLDARPVRWREVLDALRDHCKALKSVTLNNPLEDPRVSEQDYPEFLMSYGDKLESACAQMLGKEDVRQSRKRVQISSV